METILVIKSGGSKGNTFEYVLDNLADMWLQDRKWIYLHGGSNRTDEVAEKLGHPAQFVTTGSGFTSRRTDRKTLEIFTMVYAGEINKRIVEGLQQRGINAIGLSGADGRILEGPRKKSIKIIQDEKTMMLHDDYTGIVKSVNSRLLLSLIHQGYAPVVCPPAISFEHELINVDGDRAAAAVANALNSDTLILLTGAPGLLTDINDPNSTLKTVSQSELDDVMQKYAQGRMRIKLLAVKEALEGSVNSVFISKSDIINPIDATLKGLGTRFIKGQ